LVYEDSPEYQ